MASRQRLESPPRYPRRVYSPERISSASIGQSVPSSYDPYYERDPRDFYKPAKSSGERVIPVSTETYRNGTLISSNRNHDPYYDPQRASVAISNPFQWGSGHRSSASMSSASARNGPTVIHQTVDRPESSTTRASDRYERGGYYVTPAVSDGRRERRKTYSIEDGKRARLIEAPDRDGDYLRAPQRHEPRYHLTGPKKRSPDIDELGGYEYAEPREIFENTEPRRQTRRQGSVDAPIRDRPKSFIETYAPTKSGARETGPPPATRALERVNNGGIISRRESLRSPVVSPPRYRERARYGSFGEDDDNYRVAPRQLRERLDAERIDVDEQKKWEDRNVGYRGFGLRPADLTNTRDRSLDSRTQYVPAGAPLPPRDYLPEQRRSDRRLETEQKARDRPPQYDDDYDRIYEKDRARDRDIEIPRRRERDTAYENTRESSLYDDELYRSDGRYSKEQERTAYASEPPRKRETKAEDGYDVPIRERSRDDRKPEVQNTSTGALPAAAAAAGAAAFALNGQTSRQRPDEDRSRAKESKDIEIDPREERRIESPDETFARSRHYIPRDDKKMDERTDPREAPTTPMDPDEEFRLRVQREATRVSQAKTGDTEQREGAVPQIREPSRAYGDETYREFDDEPVVDSKSRALVVPSKEAEKILDAPMTDEPAVVVEESSSKSVVKIVEPKDKEAPKGILRKPTERFPEYTNVVREGVAPHKDAAKKGVPKTAKWTKISRSMVNPQALVDAEERFEEREDFVIVLRALAKDEIQKLADRTQKIREERERQREREREREREKERDREREREGDRERDRDRERHHHERRHHRRRDHDDEDDNVERDDR